MAGEQKKAVLVIGMHRSGTSALIAGIHQALGIDLGSIRDCYFPENPKGFFENFEIVQLNNKILSDSKGSWDSIGFGEKMVFSSPAFTFYRQAAVKLIEKSYKNFKILGLKDPRITILLPFWEKVLEEIGVEAYRVVALRSPLEVACSQKYRHRQYLNSSLDYLSGEDLRYTLNLWFWYNLRLLKDLPDDNNIMVSFNALLDDPTSQMQRIGRLIGVETNREGMEEYESSFLEKQLKHHNIDDAEAEPYLVEYGHVFELYNRMKQFASRDKLTKADAKKLLDGMPDDRILQSWTAPIHGYVHTVKEKLSQTQQDIALKDRTLAGKNQEIANLQGTVSQKDTIIEDKDQALAVVIAQREKAIEKLKETITQNTKELSDANAEISKKERQITDLKDKLGRREQALEKANTDIANLQAAVAEKDRSLTDANTVITENNSAITALEEAVSQNDNVIAEKKRAIGDLRDTNAQKETVIAEKDQALEKANINLADLQAARAEKDLVIADKDQQIHGFRQELYSVYTSKSWRFTLPMRKVSTVARRILSISHRPWLRAKIKRLYFLLPALVRNSRLIDNLKNRFKQKEIP